jgi:hypothetical protein
LIDQEADGVESAERQLAQPTLSPDESEELEVTTTEISNRISLLKDTLRTLRRQEGERWLLEPTTGVHQFGGGSE